MAKRRTYSIFSILILVSLLFSACRQVSPPGVREETQPASTQEGLQNTPEATESLEALVETIPTATAELLPPVDPQALEIQQPVFATFQEAEVETVPAIQHEPIAADLSNVHNSFVLSDEQIERLGREGVVVSPGKEKEFYTVYEGARYANVPIFVTSDALLHSYHLLFDKVLRTAELEHFIPLLRDLNRAMLEKTDEQYRALQSTSWEEPARRSVAFVGVASRLLDSSVEVPEYAASLVDEELALVEAAAGIQPSPLFPDLEFGEDYTQYIPRGHYTRSEDLKAYFKSMMWYGRMTFRLKTRDPEAGRRETRAALLLAQALREAQVGGRPAVDAWADLYSPTVFFVGRSDDLTVMQYLGVMDAVYGKDAQLEALLDETRLEAFIAAADQLPPPMILGMVISVLDEVDETTKGMRFMGQRFVPDAYIFRQLIFRNVSTPEHRRGLPKGLDLIAAMGSERAYQHLEEMGETGYENYPEQMEKVRQWLNGLTVEEWTETLYNGWLYTFFPLLEETGEGYPAFMRSPAWLDKQIHTSLGSWAELKHDTILYAKQVYAEMGGGVPAPEPVPPRGYVEPVPQFFARLAALAEMTRQGLGSRDLLSAGDEASLQRLEELAGSLQTMAEKELRGEPLTNEEFDTIRFIGGQLEHLVMASADTDEEVQGEGGQFMDEDPQAAVIADVATDPDADFNGVPNPVVLEEGVGRVDEIHVVVPLIQADGSVFLQVAKGGVFSYYEFPWPADDRLTDEKWRGMLEAGQAPERPGWIASFFTQQGEHSDLQSAVQSFQQTITNQYWEPGFDYREYTPALEGVWPEVEALRDASQYLGHQLVRANFTSFDLQAEDLAVVTVRETWEDSLYEGESPEWDAQPVANRGPYELDVTYRLQFGQDEYPHWQVTSFQVSGAPPEWENLP